MPGAALQTTHGIATTAVGSAPETLAPMVALAAAKCLLVALEPQTLPATAPAAVFAQPPPVHSPDEATTRAQRIAEALSKEDGEQRIWPSGAGACFTRRRPARIRCRSLERCDLQRCPRGTHGTHGTCCTRGAHNSSKVLGADPAYGHRPFFGDTFTPSTLGLYLPPAVGID